MNSIIELDRHIFFFLNQLNNDWFDIVMYWVSSKTIWIPLYLFLATLLVYKYKWESIIYLIAIGIIIGITDQLISGFMKDFFKRWRPSRDPLYEYLVHVVNGYRGGKFGFASSHSGNSFALATFMYLSLDKNKWSIILFVWAMIVAYSRVYLGVHYPGDILAGGVIGILVASGVFFILKKLTPIIKEKLTPH